MKDWKQHGPEDCADSISARANAALGALPDAVAMALALAGD